MKSAVQDLRQINDLSNCALNVRERGWGKFYVEKLRKDADYRNCFRTYQGTITAFGLIIMFQRASFTGITLTFVAIRNFWIGNVL